jgi:hypothetical protein
LKLIGTRHLLVYVDSVNMLGESIHTIKSTEGLVFTSEGIGLEVNADKTKYMVMSRDHKNAYRKKSQLKDC